jgi:dolichyl-phosphate beta-glucosyltransferase
MRPPELTAVIPVYNEERRVPGTLRNAFNYLRRSKQRCEILVVDDGSRDRTVEVVGRLKGRVPRGSSLRILRHAGNRGKGAAVRTGALAAKGRVVLYMDADDSTALSEYDRLKPALREGADVAIGSRAVDRRTVQVHQPFHREAMGRIFNLMVQAAALPGLWDTQCGFKAFRSEAARRIFPLQTIEGFGFDVELLFIARKLGYRVRECPVRWVDSPDSRVRVLRDPARMALDLMTIRLNSLRGLYRGSRGRT